MTRFCILVLLLFLRFSSNAQVAIEWQNTIGGQGGDYLSTIIQTLDGGYICGASSTSNISGDKTENCQGQSDFWIVKLDNEGNLEWQNTIGGLLNDELISIAQTSDGGFICGGESLSNISGDKTETCRGNFDYWIIKLDSNGIILWQKTIGGDNEDHLTSVFQTNDGGYLCAGYSRSDISGDKTVGSKGLLDYWIIKLDSIGNLQWQKSLGGSSSDLLYSTVQTTDGGYICGGFSGSGISGDKTEVCQGSVDFWILKLNSSGVIQWQNTIGGSSHDYVKSIVQTNDGGYIVGGESFSNISGDKNENSQGMYDFWIVKLDIAGNMQWQNTIGGSDWEQIKSITQALDGGYLCAGYSTSDISGDKRENSLGSDDYWMVKLDTTGNIEWQNNIGGSDSDILNCVSPTADGGYISGGRSRSNIFGDKTEDCLGSGDLWVLKISGNLNSIIGKAYADLNSNSQQDNGEPILQGINVIESNNQAIGVTGNNGNYYTTVYDTGSFAVFPSSIISNYAVYPTSHSAYFPLMHQTDSLNDFAFQPIGIIDDLQITLIPLTRFRPGLNALYYLHYKNVGTTSLTGNIIFYPDSGVTFISSSVTPTLTTIDSVLWQTGNLSPFDEGSILVLVNVSTTTSIGDIVNSCAKIEPVAGDANPSNNQSCWEVVVTASTDPNDILVNRSTITTTELITPPYLDFIIRFQNTGNDTAFTVKVLNPIDTSMLQLNTFELVTTSHPANVTWKAWERNMEFQFDNILLPDSNVNEPLSHGFIRYRIKPKSTLAVGDSVRNNAYIYFDFNNPVPTNTAVTEIILPTFVNSIHEGVDFAIAPNPTTNDATISFMLNRDANVAVEIFNALGQLQFNETGNFSSGKKEFNISIYNFPKGVYYVKVAVEGSVGVKKMVKL